MNIAVLSLALVLGADVKPAVELLWPDGAPGARGDEVLDKPSLTLFLPEAGKANGTAVIICPGGSYFQLCSDYEGEEPAEWLRQRGVAAFVLRYRLASRYGHPAPMLDIQRAIRLVRYRAREWNIDPKKIGVWGFSAGGHLASTACTHFDSGNTDATDPIERVECRPDFAILCYSLITLSPPYTHLGCRNALLGTHPDEKLIDELSNEKHVTAQTPPTFLFHTDADISVVPENSILYYLALRQAKVPAELHIYGVGKHGAGLGHKNPALSSWTGRLEDWMKGRELLPK
jgi:acetyl esterase/lipase